MRTNLCLSIAVAFFLGVSLRVVDGGLYDAKEKTLTGTILESQSSNGVANLTVKLTPPRSTNRAQKLTTTDQQGQFNFREVEPGRYLLEIFQGLTPVYRKVFDTSSSSSREPILLTRKPTARRIPRADSK